MRIRAISLLAIAALLSIVGCQQNEVVEKFEAIAEKTCQCADAKCANDSHQALLDAIKTHAKDTVTKGGATKLKAAVEKEQKCYSDKASAVDKPKKADGTASTDPPADKPKSSDPGTK